MKIKTYAYSVVIAALLILTGCASVGSSGGSERADTGTIDIHDPSLSLSDYIRRSGGVSVHNIDGKTRVRIRGNLSFNSTSDPLFVIDGVRSGNDYGWLEGMVPVETIKSIQVLKGANVSSRFGLAASSGAIVISTKRR